MVFDGPLRVPRGMSRPARSPLWRQKVAAVMQRFSAAFPEIRYDIAWEVTALNGVAWREQSQPCVRLYGGLLRHRAIGIEAVALLFAHETGHHKGGPPYDETFTWMTCERQADFWAARFGVPAAWAQDTEKAIQVIFKGAQQLLAFETRLTQLRQGQHEHFHPGEHGEYPTPEERFQIFMSALS
jgi:hypothetical protein